jgi:general secretion pathway protein K
MKQRGAALILVLWLLIALIAIVGVLAVRARLEHMQGSAGRQQVQARFASEAAIEWVVYRMNQSPEQGRLLPFGQPYSFQWQGFDVQVSVQDESGKVDINTASYELLNQLMIAVGVEQERAANLAGAIIDFRDPDDLLQAAGGAEDPEYARAQLPYGAKDRAFQSLGELQQVLGMDNTLYRKLLPFITIYTGGSPDPNYAPQEVLQALGQNELQINDILTQRRAAGAITPGAENPNPLAALGSGTYDIRCRARRADGLRTDVYATVRVNSGGAFGQQYTPLSWRVGEAY